MRADCTSVSLNSLGVLRIQGADALSFLQGQLSNDVLQLQQARALLAGYHNPQGRVIALLHLVQRAPNDVLAVLPRELVAGVAQRLGKFILRAKVKLVDESAHWQLDGLRAGTPPADLALPATAHAAAAIGATLVVRLAGEPARWLLLRPQGERALFAEASAAAPQEWQRQVIAAGEPQVYAATSEEFVAQMLNLDALGAIAFDKGCYTGQEVVARAHYRGRVKRRLQRFVTAAPALLEPAAGGVLRDGRPFKVVDAVQLEDGRCEFLAVTPLSTDPVSASAQAAAGGTLQAQQLALPYPLPD
jgi:tRNA-modifying protein YgfZ